MISNYFNATLLPLKKYIDDESINEIKISHYKDNIGSIWLNKNGVWEEAIDKYNQPVLIENKKIEQIISYMAGTNNILAHANTPIVECAIPEIGYRFTGILSPTSI